MWQKHKQSGMKCKQQTATRDKWGSEIKTRELEQRSYLEFNLDSPEFKPKQKHK